MTINTKFVHTNLGARDWQQLAQFYEQVFDCTQVPPERNLYRPGFGHIAFAVDDVEATRQALLVDSGFAIRDHTANSTGARHWLNFLTFTQ